MAATSKSVLKKTSAGGESFDERSGFPDACKLCGSKEFHFLFKTIDYQYKVKGLFRVAQCSRCGLISQNPLPKGEEVEGYYALEDLYPYGPIHISSLRRLKNALLKGCADLYFRERGGFLRAIGKGFFYPIKRKLIPRAPYGSKLLDVGCGNGDYIFNLQELGWKVYGCELSESGAGVATEHGLNVFRGTLIDAKYPDAFFDVVRLEQVFEHIDEPDRLLQEIRRILKPCGLLLIGVPNGNALTFKIFKRHWGLLGVPFHLFQYSSSTLGQVLSKNGFLVEQFRFPAMPVCWLWSLNNILNLRFKTDREVGYINNRFFRLVCKVTFFPIARLFYLFHPEWAEMLQVYAKPGPPAR